MRVRFVIRARRLPGTPRRRAEELRLSGTGLERMRRIQMAALWREFHAWKLSAYPYASAIELYGQACDSAGASPWPPRAITRDVMVALCRRPGTLSHYLQGIRSVLHLLRADTGALADTRALVFGARKVWPPRAPPRKSVCSSAGGTAWRAKISCARHGGQRPRDGRLVARGAAARPAGGGPRAPTGVPCGRQIGRGDMADAFIICWQFCLRFGSEVVGLNAPAHSVISLHEDEGKHQVQVQFRRRKGKVAPDPVGRSRARAPRGRARGPLREGLEGMCMPASGQAAMRRMHYQAPGSPRRTASAWRHLRGRAGLRQARRCPPGAPSRTGVGDALLSTRPRRPGGAP